MPGIKDPKWLEDSDDTEKRRSGWNSKWLISGRNKDPVLNWSAVVEKKEEKVLKKQLRTTVSTDMMTRRQPRLLETHILTLTLTLVTIVFKTMTP